jgi:N-acetylmuramoyl-L-alanine amidase
MNWMRSSGNGVVWTVALLCALCQRAQGQTGPALQYDSTRGLEDRVAASPAATPDDFRLVVNRYWNLVRRFPSSGYTDNALWQAANLSLESFRRFGQDRDRYRALQLFQWLRDQYPHSPLLSRAVTQIDELALAHPSSEASAETTIRAVRREVLPDAVRITIEMDREVPFYQERLEDPSRVFFDLKGTRTIPALVDAELRYDNDVVRAIRFGRHPNSTTRVVLDLENVVRHSVFTLYEPYRIVIDCERAEPSSTAVAAAQGGAPPAAPPAPGNPVAPSPNSIGKFSVARQLGLGVSRVVIDPGHGGHDPGATAFGASEAELVLDISLRLEQLLQRQPGVDVVVTRRTDEYIGLAERIDLANRVAADLFLSIHANASANAATRGVETYFLNFALNRQAESVAARENASSEQTMSSLPAIVKAITLNSKLNESRDFAGMIQSALVAGLRPSNALLKDFGVKQAPFMVLVGASMPSVLAEVSFITNRQEARLLKQPAYRQKIADALLAGIVKYQQALKRAAGNNITRAKTSTIE